MGSHLHVSHPSASFIKPFGQNIVFRHGNGVHVSDKIRMYNNNNNKNKNKNNNINNNKNNNIYVNLNAPRRLF